MKRKTDSRINKIEQKYFDKVNIRYGERAYYETEQYHYMECNNQQYLHNFEDVESNNPFIIPHVSRPLDIERKMFKWAKQYLTQKQHNVLDLYCENGSQTKTAKELGLSQTTVYKSIWGNYDFNHGKKFGGIVARIKTVIRNLGKITIRTYTKKDLIIWNICSNGESLHKCYNKVTLRSKLDMLERDQNDFSKLCKEYKKTNFRKLRKEVFIKDYRNENEELKQLAEWLELYPELIELIREDSFNDQKEIEEWVITKNILKDEFNIGGE